MSDLSRWTGGPVDNGPFRLTPPSPERPLSHLTDAALVARRRASVPRLVDFWRGGNLEAGDHLRRVASTRRTDLELAPYPVVLQCREDLRGLLSAEECLALGI
jgi:hypothetical protein